MGVLYYFEREDKQTFALNKVYRYAPQWTTQFGVDEFRTTPTVEEVVAEFREGNEDWARRVHGRLDAWAEGQKIRCIAEHHYDIYEPDAKYEELEARITGSAHDSDYQDDGMTYIEGSAW